VPPLLLLRFHSSPRRGSIYRLRFSRRLRRGFLRRCFLLLAFDFASFASLFSLLQFLSFLRFAVSSEFQPAAEIFCELFLSFIVVSSVSFFKDFIAISRRFYAIEMMMAFAADASL